MRFQRFLPALAGLALILAATPAIAGSGPAGPTPPEATVRAFVNECRFDGTATSIPTNTLTIKHRTASGALRKTHTVPVSSDSWDVLCPGPRVRTGDKLQFFVPGADTPFKVRTIPALRLRTDRANDHIRGNAPGDPDLVELSYGACDLPLLECFKGSANTITPDPATGAFDHAASDDLRGGVLVSLSWTKDEDRTILRQHVARMVVRPGDNLVTGIGSRTGQSVAVSLRRGQAIGLANAITGSDASFRGRFRRNGSPMRPRAGDQVSSSFAGDAVMTVPQTSLTLVEGGVEGRCFKSKPVTVQFREQTGELASAVNTMTDATGHWAVEEMIPAGTRVVVWCGNGKGDVILLQRVVTES